MSENQPRWSKSRIQRLPRNLLRFLTTLLAVTLASAVVVWPVGAEESSPEDALRQLLAERSDLAAEVQNNRALLSRGQATLDSRGGVRVDGSEAELAVPGSSAAPISVDLGNGTRIGLEIPGASRRARMNGDEVIFDDILSGTSAIVHPQRDGGFRVMITIDGPDSPTRFVFPIQGDGLTRQLMTDGSVLVSDGTENGIYFPAPWAYDARGVPVPAEYRVVGDALVLQLQPGPDVEYPIVADPWAKIRKWLSKTLKFASKYVSKLASPVQLAWDIATTKIVKTWPGHLAGFSAGTLTFLVCGAGAAAVGVAVFNVAAPATVPAAVTLCSMLGLAVSTAVAEAVNP